MTKFAVKLAIDGEERLDRMRSNIRREIARLQPQPTCPEPVAIVGYGPTLKATWRQITTPWVVTTSGAHDFLLERGITPVWHVEFDPREEKIAFIDPPCDDCTYCLASVCHERMFEHLRNNQVLLWHACGGNPGEDCKVVNDAEDDGILLLGGSTSGLRAIMVAHVLGFRNFELFGLDCSYEAGEIWAGKHVGQKHNVIEIECNGKRFQTSDMMINAADEQFNTIHQLPGCRFQVHGESLFAERLKLMQRDQAAARGQWWQPIGFRPKLMLDNIAQNERLISDEYAKLNCDLHGNSAEYGSYGARHLTEVRMLMHITSSRDVLDYGCGKRGLEGALGIQIQNYDPALPDCAADPRPADIVVCADVLEHVEPESIDAVIKHLASKTRRICFMEIATRSAHKFLSDGRNAHLIIKDATWWVSLLQRHFDLLVPAFGDKDAIKVFCLPKDRKHA
jgi:uncharacterized Rossmann fold enzyme